MVENGRGYPAVTDFIYEYDDKGHRTLVRSQEANQAAYLRFTNKTSRPVDVWWRDYRGVKRFYIKIEPASHYNVNTFITHPWEFTDSETKEHYVINNKIIFRPPNNIGGMQYRTNWNVTVTVRTLRRTALLALGHRYASDPTVVGQLGLPYVLAQELQEMALLLHKRPGQPRE